MPSAAAQGGTRPSAASGTAEDVVGQRPRDVLREQTPRAPRRCAVAAAERARLVAEEHEVAREPGELRRFREGDGDAGGRERRARRSIRRRRRGRARRALLRPDPLELGGDRHAAARLVEAEAIASRSTGSGASPESRTRAADPGAPKLSSDRLAPRREAPRENVKSAARPPPVAEERRRAAAVPRGGGERLFERLGKPAAQERSRRSDPPSAAGNLSGTPSDSRRVGPEFLARPSAGARRPRGARGRSDAWSPASSAAAISSADPVERRRRGRHVSEPRRHGRQRAGLVEDGRVAGGQPLDSGHPRRAARRLAASRPAATTSAIGVASARAQGQVTIRTATVAGSAAAGSADAHQAAVAAETSRTGGDEPAGQAVGELGEGGTAREAPLEEAADLGRAVEASPARVTRSGTGRSRLRLPATTSPPGSRRRGQGSPVSDGLVEARAPLEDDSVRGRDLARDAIRTTSPRESRAATSLSRPPASTRCAVAGSTTAKPVEDGRGAPVSRASRRRGRGARRRRASRSRRSRRGRAPRAVAQALPAHAGGEPERDRDVHPDAAPPQVPPGAGEEVLPRIGEQDARGRERAPARELLPEREPSSGVGPARRSTPRARGSSPSSRPRRRRGAAAGPGARPPPRARTDAKDRRAAPRSRSPGPPRGSSRARPARGPSRTRTLRLAGTTTTSVTPAGRALTRRSLTQRQPGSGRLRAPERRLAQLSDAPDEGPLDLLAVEERSRGSLRETARRRARRAEPVVVLEAAGGDRLRHRQTPAAAELARLAETGSRHRPPAGTGSPQ